MPRQKNAKRFWRPLLVGWVWWSLQPAKPVAGVPWPSNAPNWHDCCCCGREIDQQKRSTFRHWNCLTRPKPRRWTKRRLRYPRTFWRNPSQGQNSIQWERMSWSGTCWTCEQVERCREWRFPRNFAAKFQDTFYGSAICFGNLWRNSGDGAALIVMKSRTYFRRKGSIEGKNCHKVIFPRPCLRL